MSRCFPFPPPGYERKTTTDNTEPLTKENRKEKKDTKEKRVKEKREGKERKHKDKSKEKHEEKKDRKKDRNKKDKDRHKTKDKDRNKDRSGLSSDKVPQERNSYHHFDNHDEISQKAGPSKVFKSNDSLDSRIRERASGNQMVENVANMPLARNVGMGEAVEKEKGPDAKMDKHLSAQKRMAGMGHMVEGAVNNSMVNNFVQQRKSIGKDGMEKGRKTGAKTERYLSSNEGRTGAMGNMLVERATSSHAVNFISAEQRKHIGTGRLVEKERKTDTKMDRDHVTNQERTMVGGNLQEGVNGSNTGNYNAQRRRDDVAIGMVDETGLDGKTEKDANKRIKQQKTKPLEVNAKKERHKDKNNIKKDNDKKKEKKKDDKKREKSEDKEHNIVEAGNKDQDASSIKHVFRPQDTTATCASFDGNLKRKQINGFLHENDLQPNKLHKTASFSHLPVENGRKIEMQQFATTCTSDLHGAISNTVLERATENEGHKTNGVVKSQLPPTDTLETMPTDVSKAGESSAKPHPDLKYLSQVLSVPEMGEWSETIDQEWLFGNDELRRKSSGKTTGTETSQVWAEALKIDEADVLALPYVIPY